MELPGDAGSDNSGILPAPAKLTLSAHLSISCKHDLF
jgi:hypothetical protein